MSWVGIFEVLLQGLHNAFKCAARLWRAEARERNRNTEGSQIYITQDLWLFIRLNIVMILSSCNKHLSSCRVYSTIPYLLINSFLQLFIMAINSYTFYIPPHWVPLKHTSLGKKNKRFWDLLKHEERFSFIFKTADKTTARGWLHFSGNVWKTIRVGFTYGV